MESMLFQVGLLSIPIVLLLGGLVIFMMFYRKRDKEKKDYNSEITSYESLYKQGKISKEEYNQIKLALIKKQGIELPQEIEMAPKIPKPVLKKESEENANSKNQKSAEDNSNEGGN